MQKKKKKKKSSIDSKTTNERQERLICNSTYKHIKKVSSRANRQPKKCPSGHAKRKGVGQNSIKWQSQNRRNTGPAKCRHVAFANPSKTEKTTDQTPVSSQEKARKSQNHIPKPNAEKMQEKKSKGEAASKRAATPVIIQCRPSLLPCSTSRR